MTSSTSPASAGLAHKKMSKREESYRIQAYGDEGGSRSGVSLESGSMSIGMAGLLAFLEARLQGYGESESDEHIAFERKKKELRTYRQGREPFRFFVWSCYNE